MEMRSFKLDKKDPERVLLCTEARRAIPHQNATGNKTRLCLQLITMLFRWLNSKAAGIHF